MCFCFHTVATVSFVQSSYTIEEDRIIQPMLILSNPSSFVETIQVFNTDVSATGMCVRIYIFMYILEAYY